MTVELASLSMHCITLKRIINHQWNNLPYLVKQKPSVRDARIRRRLHQHWSCHARRSHREYPAAARQIRRRSTPYNMAQKCRHFVYAPVRPKWKSHNSNMYCQWVFMKLSSNRGLYCLHRKSVKWWTKRMQWNLKGHPASNVRHFDRGSAVPFLY